MKRVLITGANGFIGANLVRRLVRDGYEVHAGLWNQQRLWRLQDLLGSIAVHPLDLRDGNRVETVIASIRPEWVFHLAVFGAYSWQTDVKAMVETNVLGTVNLVQACLKTGFEALVNTGSSSEYGWKDEAPSETALLEPNSCYAVTKASATLFCRQTAQATRTHIPTLRLYSVYGPHEEPNRLMPALVVHGLQGRYPPLVDPSVARDYVHIDDVVDAYLLAASCPGRELGAVYNLGSGKQTTLRQVVELAGSIFAYREEPVWGSMANRSWDTSVWVADSRKIRRELGWEPRCDLDRGLRTFGAWFDNHPNMLAHYSAALQAARAG